MQFTDAVTLSGTRQTGEGYLIADAKAVRSGIQLYAGLEVGKPELPVVRVYRSEAEVRSADSLRSFSHAPVTVDHPAVAVTSENWKDLAVGEVSTAATWDGNRISLPLILKDKAAIAAVHAGKRELSAGYTCDLAFEAGVTADGQAYDAVQRNIRANHVAIVDRGRAGSECRIGDAEPHNWGAAPISTTDKETVTMTEALRTVVVDGLSVQTTDQGAQAIAKLQKDLESSVAKIAANDAAHQAVIAAKDAELAKKDAALDAEKAKVLSDADLDKRVQDRADLVALATTIANDVKTAGLADAAIRKAVVSAKLGDAAIAGKPDAYIDARFDILAEDAKKVAGADPFARVLADGLKPVDGAPASTAHTAMVNDMSTAWMTQNKGAA